MATGKPLVSDDDCSGDESDEDGPGGVTDSRRNADLALLAKASAKHAPPSGGSNARYGGQKGPAAGAACPCPGSQQDAGRGSACFTPDGSNADQESQASSCSSSLAAEYLCGNREDDDDDDDCDDDAPQAPLMDASTKASSLAQGNKAPSVPKATSLAPLPKAVPKAPTMVPSVAAQLNGNSQPKPTDTYQRQFPAAAAEDSSRSTKGATGGFDLLVDESDEEDEHNNEARGHGQTNTGAKASQTNGNIGTVINDCKQPRPQTASASDPVTQPKPAPSTSAAAQAKKGSLLELMGSAVASVEEESRLIENGAASQPAQSAPSRLVENGSVSPPAQSAPKMVKPAVPVAKSCQRAVARNISLGEVQHWLFGLTIDPDVLLELQADLTTDTASCSCMGSRKSKFHVPKLDKSLWREKDFVLFLTVTKFDFSDKTHFRMLQSIYCKMINNVEVSPTGDHWEALGFQDGDPMAVFNKHSGVLHVIHMFIFFCLNFELFSYAFKLSRDSQYRFPFAQVSVVITKTVVECLLAGRLSKLINASDRGIFDNTCQVYTALILQFCAIWQRRSATKPQIERVLKEVRALLERSPSKVLGELTSLANYNAVSVVE